MKVNKQVKAPQRSSVLMYEQQLEHLKINLSGLTTRIKSLYSSGLIKWAYIIHDKDIDTETGKPIVPHLHIALQFSKRVSVDLIAKTFDDSPERLEVMTKRGHVAQTSAINAFAYLIHHTKNSFQKYQYDVSEVTASFDYPKFIKAQDEQMNPQDILDLLGDGQITKKEAINRMMALGARVLARYQKKIIDINHARIDIEHQQWVAQRKKTMEPIKIIWITGKSGTGKTRSAIDFCRQHNLSYYITSGSNAPFDGLNDLSAKEQEVIIIDELRPNVIKYLDLLQLLDPTNYEKVAVARYHNPKIMAKVIIVCTVFNPFEFYKESKISNPEIDTFLQLDRRIGLTLRLTTEEIQEVTARLIQSGIKPIYTYDVLKRHPNPYSSTDIQVKYSAEDLDFFNFDDKNSDGKDELNGKE